MVKSERVSDMSIKLNKYINKNNQKISREKIREHLIEILNINPSDFESDNKTFKKDIEVDKSTKILLTNSNTQEGKHKITVIRSLSSVNPREKEKVTLNAGIFKVKNTKGMIA